jgi:anti-anti-sigma factor
MSVERPHRTWGLEIASEYLPGGIVLVPKGRIGSVTADAFAEAVNAARKTAPRVIIDLSGVDYISGAGVNVLQKAAAHSGPRTIVCGLHDAVRITLELAGVDKDLTIERDRQAAQKLLIANP